MAAASLVAIALCLWLGVLLLPWQPWRVRERFTPPAQRSQSLADVTVLIPARNEADVIGSTLTALRAQAADINVIVIDDDSDDDTATACRYAGLKSLDILRTPPLPAGWSGKLWALEQGYRQVRTPYILLLDADILLQAGVVAGLLDKLRRERLQLVSLMARLRMVSAWNAFFFQAFALANRAESRQAAAAGGCILLEKAALDDIGGPQSLRGALIDDCTLARRIKNNGGRIWLGLSQDAISLRRYESLATIWQMVSRTAYTQLHYSPWLLLICVALLGISFIMPLVGLFFPGPAQIMAIGAIIAMALSYVPTLHYYHLSQFWLLTLPLAAILFTLMTIDSARQHISGRGTQWKQRRYSEPG